MFWEAKWGTRQGTEDPARQGYAWGSGKLATHGEDRGQLASGEGPPLPE